jgi:C-terminal processing protease CtpA/Prc
MRHQSPTIRVAVALVFLGAGPNKANAQSDSATTARLASLGRLWGVVKYFHPMLASRGVDWDSALVATIPRVKNARSRAEYLESVDQMLGVLSDPLTRVNRPPVRAVPATDTSLTVLADSTLIVKIGDVSAQVATQALTAASSAVERAPRVVFDLRTGRAEPRARIGRMTTAFDDAGMNALVVDRQTPWVARRFLMYSGFPQASETSFDYWPGVQTAAIAAPLEPKSRASKSIVWLVDRGTDIPQVALAMRAAGSAQILMEGPTTELLGTGATYRVDMADSVSANVRTDELVSFDGSVIGASRAVTARNPRDSTSLAMAIDMLRHPPLNADRPVLRTLATTPDPSYPSMTYPSAEYRLLAAFRFWNAIQYFYPYKSLTGEDWNAVLARAVPRFDAARDSLDYALAVAEFATKIHDSHAFVRSAAFGAYLGQAQPGLRARLIGHDLVVAQMVPDSAANMGGIRIGDVIGRVDGESIEAMRERLGKYIAASTLAGLDAQIEGLILNGAEGSVAVLGVRDGTGHHREVSLERHRDWHGLLHWTNEGPAWTILANNIGYVDLERLAPTQVDSMFDALRATKAIVFDDRSYPQFTVWMIASRLTDRRNVVEAIFRRPVVASPDTTEWFSDSWAQHYSASTKPRYVGKTVLLVDERTGSMAEHTGLLFKTANGTTIVGSQTMGANGDVTSVVLPGAIFVNFTGQEVTHANGAQLQRVGLEPDIVVRPTVVGIRARKDEVLDRALQFLQKGH